MSQATHLNTGGRLLFYLPMEALTVLASCVWRLGGTGGTDAGGGKDRLIFLYSAQLLLRSLNRWIFPVAVFGSSSTKLNQRGYL